MHPCCDELVQYLFTILNCMKLQVKTCMTAQTRNTWVSYLCMLCRVSSVGLNYMLSDEASHLRRMEL